MGDATMENISKYFSFSSGTDLSSWLGNMFTSFNFGWNRTGTTQFATYYRDNGLLTPGISIGSEDLVGDLWTPDNFWTKPGTFASIGLAPGACSIVDAITKESIAIQIGEVSPAPAPGPLPVLALLQHSA
jgi:hypothetical protein